MAGDSGGSGGALPPEPNGNGKSVAVAAGAAVGGGWAAVRHVYGAISYGRAWHGLLGCLLGDQGSSPSNALVDPPCCCPHGCFVVLAAAGAVGGLLLLAAVTAAVVAARRRAQRRRLEAGAAAGRPVEGVRWVARSSPAVLTVLHYTCLMRCPCVTLNVFRVGVRGMLAS